MTKISDSGEHLKIQIPSDIFVITKNNTMQENGGICKLATNVDNENIGDIALALIDVLHEEIKDLRKDLKIALDYFSGCGYSTEESRAFYTAARERWFK